MLVGNFTPDDIEWSHIGHIGLLKAGIIEDFADARANHILTKFGPRGLLKVDWKRKDDVTGYTREAMVIYTNFWQMQIGNFNQQNEQRKNENKPYTPPTRQLAEKAEELGVELVEAWRAVKKTETAEMAKVHRENEDLREELTGLKDNFREMMDMMKELKGKPTTPIIIDTASFLRQFNNLGKDRYQNWVIDNMNDIPSFPASVYENAKTKWKGFYRKDEWPVKDCTGPNDL